MKLKNKFLDLLSLSLLWIKDSATVKAVTDEAQSFSGIKTLADMAISPNSGDDLDAMPMTEVLTHGGMNKYLEEMVEPQGFISVPDPNDEDAVIVFPISDNPKPGTYNFNLGWPQFKHELVQIPPVDGVSYYGRIGTRFSL